MAERVIHNYIAGALGGTIGLFAGYPLDTTKVQLQTCSKLSNSQIGGLIEAARKIHNHGGWVRGFYRGLSWPMFSYGITYSVFFGVQGNVLKRLETNKDRRSDCYFKIFLSGCAGGAAQLIPVIPTDYIKVVLQSQIPNATAELGTATAGGAVIAAKRTCFNGPLDCAWHVYKKEGLLGFYKGSHVVMCRDIPSYGMYSLTYQYLSNKLKEKGWTDSRGIMADMIGGGCAGSFTWFLIMPFDVVKSRYQADLKGEFRSPLDCAIKSYQREGYRVFYRGVLVTCLRSLPVDATAFMIYAQTMRYLEGVRD
ncbi:solute carrier family 25 member 45-like [Pecten maximus]|uniref:solute carrier family 25 member 45-like n=1 Tax=Pecten maximus TaxID=6579 RepID=UPI001458605A|nr:solute carrier family 25 member 45-like [Pecten maximus]